MVLLPPTDNQGQPHGREPFRAASGALAERFAGHREEAAKGLPSTDFTQTILAFTEVRLSRDI